MERKEYNHIKGLFVNQFKQESVEYKGRFIPLSTSLKERGKDVKKRMNIISIVYFMIVMGILLVMNQWLDPSIAFMIFIILYIGTMIGYTKYYRYELNRVFSDEEIDRFLVNK